MIKTNKTETHGSNKTITRPFALAGVLCLVATVCSPVLAKASSATPNLNGQTINLLDGSTAKLIKTKNGYALQNADLKNHVFSGFVKDAQGNLYKVDAIGDNKVNITPFKHNINLKKTVIDNCDMDGNKHIYGRKDALKNNINMVIAREEFKCKQSYEIKEAKAGLAEAKAGLEAAEARGKELDASIEAGQKKLAELTRKRDEALKELNQSYKELKITVENN